MLQQPPLLISGFMANPSGTDDNKEFVELLATRTINFATENYTVVFNDGSNAGTHGWASGGTGSYAITLNAGSITAGEKLYVGGTSYTTYVTGSSCKAVTRNTSSAAGSAFNGGATGTASGVGVLGNGGNNADGLAVFAGASGTISSTSIPIDAIFFGTAVGSATGKFTLPANDQYAGSGKFGSTGNTFLAPDPGTDDFLKATGTYNTNSGTWTTNRTWATVSLASTTLNCTTTPSGVTLSGAPATGTLTFAPSASQSPFLSLPDVSGVINNPTDPLSTIGVNFDVKESGTAIPAADYSMSAASSKTVVVPVANVVFTKNNGRVHVKVNPTGVGYATITLTLTKGSSTKTYTINYAASNSSANITTAR